MVINIDLTKMPMLFITILSLNCEKTTETGSVSRNVFVLCKEKITTFHRFDKFHENS